MRVHEESYYDEIISMSVATAYHMTRQAQEYICDVILHPHENIKLMLGDEWDGIDLREYQLNK